jgi:hypothetical protein
VLEQRLRAMVSDVERSGNRIILSGLGPSSRAINRHDTTVIDVWAEDGVTNIGADVSFQASAFLGATGQEEIMRLKLERLFEETKEQLDYECRRSEARLAHMHLLAGIRPRAVAPEQVNEPEPESSVAENYEEPSSLVAHEQHEEEMASDIASPVAAEVQAEEPVSAAIERPTDLVEVNAAPPAASVDTETDPVAAEQATEPEPEFDVPVTAAVEETHATVEDAAPDVVADESSAISDPPAEAAVVAATPPEASPVVDAPRAIPLDQRIKSPEPVSAGDSEADIIEDDVAEEGEEGNRSRRRILWGALGVLAACIPAFLPYGVHYFSSLRTGSELNQPVAEVSVPPAAKPIPAADPVELLRQWEMAMRSRDAAAQAAFYAVPVERYLKRYNVSKAQVQADKQAKIDKRKGLWTVKMEQVKIDRKSNTTATVTLLKHYTEQQDRQPVKEWFVSSQLKLKNEYGIWWITSEHDLGWATSPDEL